MALTDVLHQLRARIGCVRRYRQVYMVRHQAVRVHRAMKTRGESLQVIKVGEVINLLKETTVPIVPSLHDVDTDIGYDEARRPRHNSETTRPAGRLTGAAEKRGSVPA
jgi:hypothetical protein